MSIQLTKGFCIGFHDYPTTELGYLCFNGKSDAVREQLSSGLDWDSQGTYPLHAALLGHHIDLATLLLERGSPVNEEIYHAALYADVDFYRRLPQNRSIQEPLEQNWKNHRLSWHLLTSYSADHESEIRQVLDEGAQPGVQCHVTANVVGYYPIHLAARARKPELAEALLKKGADPNVLNNEGQSAMRMILDDQFATKPQKRKFAAILRSYGGISIPPYDNWFSRIKMRLCS